MLCGLLYIALESYADDGVLIANDAKVWPPTLMAYTSKVKDVCPTNLSNYGFLGVGENATVKGYKHICVTYSPIGLVWMAPQLCTPNESIALKAKVIDHQLQYRLVVH